MSKRTLLEVCLFLTSTSLLAGAEHYHPSDDWKSWDYDEYGNAFELKPKLLIQTHKAPKGVLSEPAFLFQEQDIFGDYSCEGWGYSKPECREEFIRKSVPEHKEVNWLSSDPEILYSFTKNTTLVKEASIKVVPIAGTALQFLMCGIGFLALAHFTPRPWIKSRNYE